jgi:hypothetical protein
VPAEKAGAFFIKHVFGFKLLALGGKKGYHYAT